MVCSPALGNGINTTGVTHIYHAIAGIYSMTDYHQESGRAGRQAKVSTAMMVITQDHLRQLERYLCHPDPLHVCDTAQLNTRFRLRSFVQTIALNFGGLPTPLSFTKRFYKQRTSLGYILDGAARKLHS